MRAVARALRCGLATVQRARLAVGMRGAPRPVSGSGPEYGAVAALWLLPPWLRLHEKG